MLPLSNRGCRRVSHVGVCAFFRPASSAAAIVGAVDRAICERFDRGCDVRRAQRGAPCTLTMMARAAGGSRLPKASKFGRSPELGRLRRRHGAAAVFLYATKKGPRLHFEVVPATTTSPSRAPSRGAARDDHRLARDVPSIGLPGSLVEAARGDDMKRRPALRLRPLACGKCMLGATLKGVGRLFWLPEPRQPAICAPPHPTRAACNSPISASLQSMDSFEVNKSSCHPGTFSGVLQKKETTLSTSPPAPSSTP